jgi:hypothetical protein
MKQNVPDNLLNSLNNSALAYLGDSSAHSDLTESLLRAIEPLGAVESYCPDASEYRYLVVSVGNVIFGLAAGMNTVAFRLSHNFCQRAIATGGITIPALGDAWVGFILFRNDWPAVDLRFWAQKAYVHARELSVTGSLISSAS